MPPGVLDGIRISADLAAILDRWAGLSPTSTLPPSVYSPLCIPLDFRGGDLSLQPSESTGHRALGLRGADKTLSGPRRARPGQPRPP